MKTSHVRQTKKTTAQAVTLAGFCSCKTGIPTFLYTKGRYKSQALLDEASLAACMAYVDLNPIQAAIAKTPESSKHTSIKLRLKKSINKQQPTNLFPFTDNPRKDMPEGLPFKLLDYIALVEWTGRQMQADKRGKIDSNLPPILERLNFEAENWLYITNHFESKLKGLVGSLNSLKEVCKKLGYDRTVCKQSCAQFFP